MLNDELFLPRRNSITNVPPASSPTVGEPKQHSLSDNSMNSYVTTDSKEYDAISVDSGGVKIVPPTIDNNASSSSSSKSDALAVEFPSLSKDLDDSSSSHSVQLTTKALVPGPLDHIIDSKISPPAEDSNDGQPNREDPATSSKDGVSQASPNESGIISTKESRLARFIASSIQHQQEDVGVEKCVFGRQGQGQGQGPLLLAIGKQRSKSLRTVSPRLRDEGTMAAPGTRRSKSLRNLTSPRPQPPTTSGTSNSSCLSCSGDRESENENSGHLKDSEYEYANSKARSDVSGDVLRNAEASLPLGSASSCSGVKFPILDNESKDVGAYVAISGPASRYEDNSPRHIIDAAIKKQILTAEESSNVLMPNLIDRLDGVDSRACTILAIKLDVGSSKECTLNAIGGNTIHDILDAAAVGHRIGCIRKFGGTWVGCVGYFRRMRWKTQQLNSIHAIQFACEVTNMAKSFNWSICCAIDSGNISGGFFGDHMCFDMIGPEVRWVLAMSDITRSGEICVSNVTYEAVRSCDLVTERKLTFIRHIPSEPACSGIDTGHSYRVCTDFGVPMRNPTEILNLAENTPFNPKKDIAWQLLHKMSIEVEVKNRSQLGIQGGNHRKVTGYSQQDKISSSASTSTLGGFKQATVAASQEIPESGNSIYKRAERSNQIQLNEELTVRSDATKMCSEESIEDMFGVSLDEMIDDDCDESNIDEKLHEIYEGIYAIIYEVR